MPQFELLDFRSTAYSVRMAAVRQLLHQPDHHLTIAETAVGISAKAQLLQKLRTSDKDGIVLKKVNGVSRRGGMAVDGYSLQCVFPRAVSAGRAASSPGQANGTLRHTS